MVKVILTPSAIEDAESVYRYLDVFSHRAAQTFKEEVVAAARRLKQMPEMGPVEPTLEHLERNYRYVLVLSKYKLIYLYEENICSVLMLWDCRQNPKILKNSDRFESLNP
jgi:plasmid stabilization system protein ParE